MLRLINIPFPDSVNYQIISVKHTRNDGCVHGCFVLLGNSGLSTILNLISAYHGGMGEGFSIL